MDWKYVIHASLLIYTRQKHLTKPWATCGILRNFRSSDIGRLDLTYISSQFEQTNGHTVCVAPPVLKTGAMAQETNTERTVLKDTAQIQFVTVIFLSN